MKKIIVIMDGAGDKRIKAINNKTPLEKAITPSMDFLAEKGVNGRMKILSNFAPESDVALFPLYGFNPIKEYTGRGPLESLGMNYKIKPGELALRGNFATVKKGRIIDRRVARTLSTKEGKLLEKEINEKVKLPAKFVFKHSIEHRFVLILKGNYSKDISNTDPAYERAFSLLGIAKKKPKNNKIIACKPLNNSRKALKTAALVNEFIEATAKVLSESKVNKKRKKKKLLQANFVLLRDAGNKLPKLNKLKCSWLAIVGMPLEIGFSKLLGMKVHSFNYPEFNARNKWSSLKKRLLKEVNESKKAIKKNWNKFDCFYVHFKATDVAGHDGNYKKKIEFLELIDKHFFSWLLKEFNLNDFRITVTADHCTPCKLKRHSSDPVPVLISGKNVKADKVNKFSEYNKGKLKLFNAINLMKLFNKKELK